MTQQPPNNRSETFNKMGPGTSTPSPNFIKPFEDEMYVPIPSNHEFEASNQPVSNRTLTTAKSSILRTDYAGVWSIYTPLMAGPRPRTGHFSCYCPETHTAYIGYGATSQGELMNDLWAFDTVKKEWREIPLSGATYRPRSGARADMTGHIIVVFGGYSDPEYFADLHVIDSTTGVITRVDTTGPQPEPRSSPVLAVYNKKLYLWGGYNGAYPSDLYVLDMVTREWTTYAQDVGGRTSVPWALNGNILYSYGGSKTSGLVTINLDEYKVKIVTTTGAEPPSGVFGAGMVLVDHFLFFFGGKATNKWTLMYACDIRRNWWFVFHIRPDGQTVSVADGSVSDLGLFMLPRINSFGVCYESETREILAYLGQPEKDPPPIFVLSVGEALASLHLRDDMLEMVSVDGFRNQEP